MNRNELVAAAKAAVQNLVHQNLVAHIMAAVAVVRVYVAFLMALHTR